MVFRKKKKKDKSKNKNEKMNVEENQDKINHGMLVIYTRFFSIYSILQNAQTLQSI